MEKMTRNEIIEAIIEHKEYSYIEGEDMPRPPTKQKLSKLTNDELIEYYEECTTNFGLYSIVENV